jgi:hypothetical protein
MFEYNDVFYLIVYSRNYSYAFGASNGYVRFRDTYSEITVEPCVPGLTSHVIQNANSIRFQQRSINTTAQVEQYEKRKQYTFTVAGNTFYIIDSKTMVKGNAKYEVVTDNDFSSLFQ